MAAGAELSRELFIMTVGAGGFGSGKFDSVEWMHCKKLRQASTLLWVCLVVVVFVAVRSLRTRYA